MDVFNKSFITIYEVLKTPESLGLIEVMVKFLSP